MSDASLDWAVPVKATEPCNAGQSTGDICDSLIDDIQALRIEASATGQKLQRLRHATRRIRQKLLRLHKASRQRLKRVELGSVGETSLAEAVLAAQIQSKRVPVESRHKRLRPKQPEDSPLKMFSSEDSQKNRAFLSGVLGLMFPRSSS